MYKVIETDRAPAAIGPYSQAVEVNGFLFVSGQIPLHPESGEVVGDGISAQTEQVINNLLAIIEGAGASIEDIVKCTCFLANMEDFGAFNEVYANHFGRTAPARECVAVLGLPKNVLVEISAICGR